MKRPNIDMQSKRMMVETETYSDMINALINQYRYLRICRKSFMIEGLEESVKYTEEHIIEVESALIKAGVEL